VTARCSPEADLSSATTSPLDYCLCYREELLWEMMLMYRKAGSILLLVVLTGCPAFAQDWARKMFKETEHDFGYVARGAKAEYEFPLSNIYLEDVHIAGVRSSCGCTTPRIKQEWLKTYEKGAIIASFNTPLFLGRKGATVTVTFDKPFYAEVQLHVTGYIRGDVVFRPGSAQLGSVDQGTPADTKVAVGYAGRSDWQILEVKSANPHLSGKVVETARGGGRVSYELLVHLDANAPAGYVQDHLMLITSDRGSAQVPVPVEGYVAPPITVSPASLFMGVVPPGKQVTKQLVVRGSRPFRILSITCDDASFTFKTSEDGLPKALHVIPVTFAAGASTGKVVRTIRIETDLGETAPQLAAYAVVSRP
jgi:hypothetical protein